MKKWFLIFLLFTISFTLISCDKQQSIITINIEDGYNVTQYTGETTLHLNDVSATDQDGMDLSPFFIIDGTYDLNTVGEYPLTLTVSDNYGTTLTINFTLNILEKTCDIDPTQEGCTVQISGIEFTSATNEIDTVFVDEFIKLSWQVIPLDAPNVTFTITSSDETIAKVSPSGYVFGVEPGEVTITVTTTDGSFTIAKTVTVIEKSCTDDPLQDKCVYVFLEDTSRIIDVPDANLSGTNYQTVYVNNKIYYEIFVRTFADHSGNNVGDFQGIIDTLPYLKQLGIGGLWLMPIHESTSDHGYNVDDYYSVNKDYGTMTDFRELVEAANLVGIDIIIDLVVNHMGAHNDIFQDVLKNGIYSEYYDWFTWIDTSSSRSSETGSWGQTIWYNPTYRGWLKASTFTIHSTLQNKSYFGYFSDWMPDLNLENPEVVQYIYDVADFWLTDVGVQGFRMDATSHLYALHEHPSILNRQQANIDFLSNFNQHCQSSKTDTFIVTEAWESYDVYTAYFESGVNSFNFQANYWIKDAANGVLQGTIGDQLQLIYNKIEQVQSTYIDPVFISNHDMDRVAKVLSDPNKTRLAAEILLSLPGNPFIYYGDELGMKGTRTNMIWGDYYDSLFVEFEDRAVPTVSIQLANPDSLLHTYIKLASVRNNSLALSYGDFIPYNGTYAEGYYRVFEQGNDKELVVVLFNFSSITTIPIPSEFTSYEILYQSYENNFGGISPRGTVILHLPYSLKTTVLP